MKRLLRTAFRLVPDDGKRSLRSLQSDLDFTSARMRRALRSRPWQSLSGVAAPSSRSFANGVVSITFDDDLVDAYAKARPLMDVYGWGGTGYVLAYTVGTHLTLEELHSLERTHGWEVAGHGFAGHVDLTTLTLSELDSEIRSTRQWLEEHNFRGQRHFAYPYSRHNRRVRAVVEQYFDTARVVMGGAGNLLPPEASRRYRLGAFTWGAGYSSTDSIVQQLERVRTTASWAILVFHGIDRSGAYSISTAEFSELLSHIDRLHLAVAPVGDVMRAFYGAD